MAIDAGIIKGAGANIASALASFLGPESRICCGNEYDQRRPAMTYNRYHNEYMVVSYQVLNAGGAILGARIGLDGWAYSTFLLSRIGEYDCCLHPDVAFNRTNDEYLVVWQQYNSSQSKWEIYGLLVPWDGPDYAGSLATPFLIAQWSNLDLMYPKVAWNSYRNEYMVVWHTEHATSGALLDIGRRRLRANGSHLSNADYMTNSSSVGVPDIAYNPAADQFVVVWAQAGTGSVDIYGGKLTVAGTLSGSVFAIGATAKDEQFPAIVTNEQDRYLVVWQHKYATNDWDIYGQFLNGSAGLVGANIPFDVSIWNESRPAVAVNGATREYLIVYQKTTLVGDAIWGKYVDEDGVTLDWFEVTPGGLVDNAHPAVATHLAGYFVAYESWWVSGSVTDLYGRMWSPHAVFLPLVVR